MSFNDKLMQLRKSMNLSQEELGDRLNVTRQTVSKWELGQTTPEMDKLVEMSRIFNISIDSLVGNEIPKENDAPYHCRRRNYEYKSERRLWGLPLVHINVGHGLRKAKGIIAIGTIAQGVVTIGVLSMGIISFGAVSLGCLSLGAIAAALIALGGLSFGGIAVGGCAFGIVAIGGLAIGSYSLGGCAIAAKIALGGFAQGHIAIGDKVAGDIVFKISDLGQNDYASIKQTILQEYPNIWQWVLNLFC